MIGIVIPDETNLKKKFPEKIQLSMEHLAKDPHVKEAVMKDMERVGKEAKLNVIMKKKKIFAQKFFFIFFFLKFFFIVAEIFFFRVWNFPKASIWTLNYGL